jgi:hypothetical protein
MDDCETWVYEYLRYMGVPADEIIFEPNGKSTFPDFQVKGRIGVEVRRLNQHKKNGQGRWEPLEELARPLHDRLLSLLDEFGPPAYGASWHVLYRFQRPQKTKKWEPVLRHKLKDFLGLQLPDHETTIFIDEHFELRLLRRAEPSDKTFILIDIDDFDSGGWVDAELQANIPISIDEKTNKRAAYRGPLRSVVAGPC